MAITQEHQRLTTDGDAWRRWGPYLSERQWGTVREDYSSNGDAWNYFSHDMARYRAYHWGEDGLAGYSDDHAQLCFALALWNGNDPILKERLYGVTNSEGNHGEDVKEYYYYLDSTPTHSYMKYLYKYPQAAYPYENLWRTNRERSRKDFEYELIDTGVFDDDRYFDVFVEYAKPLPNDTLVRITVHNRGPEAAQIQVLPTLWFRNTWSWGTGQARPKLTRAADGTDCAIIQAEHSDLGTYFLYAQGANETLFTENDTNTERLNGEPNAQPYVKDAFHEYLIHQRQDAVNPANVGTKAAARYSLTIPAGGSAELCLRLTDAAPDTLPNGAFASFNELFELRRTEADEFYDAITPDSLSDDHKLVMRQALAGMLWSKQHYFFDIDNWLGEHGVGPHTRSKKAMRNAQWYHMFNDDILSMPDKWEYPWFAAWDLAFHSVALAAVDIDFAKNQLDLMLQEAYLHPNGQIPAYEWNFSDVNPPVHAWAVYMVYETEKQARGVGDLNWLKGSFNKLLINFTWWVNRKDPSGRNVFEGGFLGLDNIGLFDRSAPLPNGGTLEQADGTAWMALFAQNMLEIALELAQHDPAYARLANKFMEHFFWIAAAMDREGNNDDELWDEEDGFFYDLLRLPDGTAMRIKVRSLVGLLPLCAVSTVSGELIEKYPRILSRIERFLADHPELCATIAPPARAGVRGRRLLSVLDETKLRRVLTRMLDEERFLSPYGIRSLSLWHLEHPYVFNVHGQELTVKYVPAESDSGMFGGNSNWRGPIWMPVNYLIARALLVYYMYYGDSFTIECPTGSGNQMNLAQVARYIGERLANIFLRDAQGRRPVFGGVERFQRDPHWRDCILFYEYFHGDNGAGLGASHQTGWTGLVARVIQASGYITQYNVLEEGLGVLRHFTESDLPPALVSTDATGENAGSRTR